MAPDPAAGRAQVAAPAPAPGPAAGPTPGPLALSRLAHDRAGHRRTDDAWLARAWPGARVLPVTTTGLLPVTRPGSAELVDVDGAAADTLPGRVAEDWPGAIFLGVAGDRPWFAVVVADDAPAPGGGTWVSLREVGARVDELDAGLSTSAVALVAWHARNRFCPRCGSPTTAHQAGWTRRCTAHGHEVFPRTDPAVIMLVHDGGDRCVLGRQAVWPAGRFSVLAGFVEAGEPLEAAVVREVAEEVGITVTDVRFVASQPWPFPQSLMLGCVARAVDDTIAPRDDEIAEAFWFTRAEVAAAAEWDAPEESTTGVGPGGVMTALPGPVSIARQLLDAWVAGRL